MVNKPLVGNKAKFLRGRCFGGGVARIPLNVSSVFFRSFRISTSPGPSLKLTFSNLKMDGWNTFSFPFGARDGLFSRGYVWLLVSGSVEIRGFMPWKLRSSKSLRRPSTQASESSSEEQNLIGTWWVPWYQRRRWKIWDKSIRKMIYTGRFRDFLLNLYALMRSTHIQLFQL